MSWIKRHPNLTLILISTLFSAVLVEILLRLVGIGYGNAPIELNQRLHHLHPRNYEFVFYHPGEEFIGHKIFYDEFGYRVKSKNPVLREDNAVRRIAFLGDGFTEANSVSWEQSFVGLIESKNSNLNVRNFGVASYSPVIYLVQINNEVKTFKPTDVVVQIFENDFYDDIEYLKKANTKTLSEIKLVSGGASNIDIVKKIFRHSYLARLVRKVQLQLSIFFLDRINDPSKYFPSYAGTLTNEDERKLTYETILQLKDFANKINARIFFFLVPNKQLMMQNQCCESDTLAAEFHNFIESHNLNLIDLPKAFGNYPDQTKLFFEQDVHFSAEGNLVTAEAISNKLRLDE